jgi:DMSO reductase anchor subunit
VNRFLWTVLYFFKLKFEELWKPVATVLGVVVLVVEALASSHCYSFDDMAAISVCFTVLGFVLSFVLVGLVAISVGVGIFLADNWSEAKQLADRRMQKG